MTKPPLSAVKEFTLDGRRAELRLMGYRRLVEMRAYSDDIEGEPVAVPPAVIRALRGLGR